MNIQTRIDGQSREEAHSSDFALWAIAQGRLLREGRFDELDIENLFDEVDDLGQARRSELRSRLETLIEHMLKLNYGTHPYPRSGWRKTMLNARHEIDHLLDESPSLHRYLPDFYEQAWHVGQTRAVLSFWDHEPDRYEQYEKEIPETPIYSLDQVLAHDFFPQRDDT